MNETSPPSPRVTLKAKRDQSIRRRHPWVFSGGIKRVEGQPKAGDWVQVFANKGACLGWGHYSPDASIAVRMLTFEDALPDDQWWHQQIADAVRVRKDLGLFGKEDQNACRLIHAEGDGMPGLIADLYGSVLVLQCHTPGMHRHLDALVEGFKLALGDVLVGVYDKSAKTLAKNGGVPSEDGWVWGKAPGNHKALEYGNQYVIDWEKGQKTGFFLDQRENRALLGSLSKGMKVLNVFSYTGGFSISALAAGAVAKVSVVPEIV